MNAGFTVTSEVILPKDVPLRKGCLGVPHAHMRFLTQDDLDAVMAVQERVAQELASQGKGGFIVPKTRERFAQLMGAAGRMVGIFHEGRLVAQSIVALPTEADPSLPTGMKLPCAPQDVAELCGMLVLREFRGNGFMHHLVNVRVALARQMGRRYAVSEVAIGNPNSWGVLLAQGLQIAQCGIDPDDGCQLYYAAVDLRQPVVLGEVEAYLSPETNWEQQVRLFAEGYVGCVYDNGRMGLARLR